MKLLEKVRCEVKTQDYSPKLKIGGVELVELRCFVDDSGSFAELLRISRNGKALTVWGFFLLAGQINHSEVEPGAIKAWHLQNAVGPWSRSGSLAQDPSWSSARLCQPLFEGRSSSLLCRSSF